MGNAYKKLGTNISLFTISSFGTKILSFVLVPLYTNYLTTAEYGTADLLSTIVSLLIPIFTLDVADAVIRFTLDDNTDEESVLGVAVKIIFLGAGLLALILFTCRVLFHIDYPASYMFFIFINFLLSSFYNSLSNYFRGKDKITDIVVAGLMCTLINGVTNIILLLKFHMGINGYLMAHVLGVLVPTLYLFVRSFQCGIIKFHRMCESSPYLLKQMLLYCTPLIINGLSWWINNSLDRIFVTSMCGVDANGLLAVSYKIPSILSMFQTIFNQAWTMSVVQEFDPQDKNGFLSGIYSLYGCGMTIVCSSVLLLNIPLAKILYAKDFYQAWQFTGMLVVAQLFGALSICISGVFSAVKDSKTLASSTLIGALVNTLLNYFLIGRIGVQGAVIATLISNLVIWAYRMHKVKKYVSLKIRFKRDLTTYLLVILQCVFGLFEGQFYLGQLICMGLILFLYRRDVSTVGRTFCRKGRQMFSGKR